MRRMGRFCIPETLCTKHTNGANGAMKSSDSKRLMNDHNVSSSGKVLLLLSRKPRVVPYTEE